MDISKHLQAQSTLQELAQALVSELLFYVIAGIFHPYVTTQALEEEWHWITQSRPILLPMHLQILEEYLEPVYVWKFFIAKDIQSQIAISA